MNEIILGKLKRSNFLKSIRPVDLWFRDYTLWLWLLDPPPLPDCREYTKSRSRLERLKRNYWKRFQHQWLSIFITSMIIKMSNWRILCSNCKSFEYYTQNATLQQTSIPRASMLARQNEKLFISIYERKSRQNLSYVYVNTAIKRRQFATVIKSINHM